MGAVRHSRHTRARVIEEFRKCGRVDLACDRAGVSRASHYEWLQKHEDYRAMFEAAREPVADMLEAEAVRRAYEGTLKPVFSQGKRALDFVLDEHGQPKLDKNGKPIAVPASIREYSNDVLMFLLEGRRSEVFGRKVRLAHSGSVVAPGADIVTEVKRLFLEAIQELPDETRQRISRKLMERSATKPVGLVQ